MQLEGKTFLITGIANKKSVAYQTACLLLKQDAKLIFTGQTEKHIEKIKTLFPNSPVILLDVEKQEHLNQLNTSVESFTSRIDGILHSMAFANFSEGPRPFHETKRQDFLQACQISSFSLVEITNKLTSLLTDDASIVTVSISNTKATSYGYLGPIKAMLETTVCYLAKSLSEVTSIRVNSVGAGPLKTSASAGIPNYIENYLYSEALTLRKKSLATIEVANTILYLLSPLSSGINAQNIIVDAGMSSNYFDQKVVNKYAKNI